MPLSIGQKPSGEGVTDNGDGTFTLSDGSIVGSTGIFLAKDMATYNASKGNTGGGGGGSGGGMDFTDPNNYGYGNFTPGAIASTGFYNDLAKYYSQQQAPQMQRTAIDFSGYGSGQGAPPPQTDPMAGYPTYPGPGTMADPLTRGINNAINAPVTYPDAPIVSTPPPAPTPGGSPSTTGTFGGGGTVLGGTPTGGATGGTNYSQPTSSLGSPISRSAFGAVNDLQQSPTLMGAGGAQGALTSGAGGLGSGTLLGQQGGGAPPPSGGGMSPMSLAYTPDDAGGIATGGPGPLGASGGTAQTTLTGAGGQTAQQGPAQVYQPATPNATGIQTGGPGPLGASGGTAQGLLTGNPANTPQNAARTSNSFVPMQPPAQPGGTPQGGQYANPLFQQGQLSRNTQNDVMSRFSQPGMYSAPGQEANAGQSRDAQMGLVNRLNSDLNGGQPSLAEMQMRRGAQSNIAAANAMAASGGPNGAAASRRQAMNSMTAQNQNLVGQTAALRAQEYAQARGELGGATANLRGQDINQLGQQYQNITSQGQLQAQQSQAIRAQDLQATGMSYDNAVKQAQLEMQQNAGQAQLEAQQRANNAAMAAQYYGMNNANAQTDLASRMHYMDLMSSKYANDRGLAQQAGQFQTQQNNLMTGTALSTAGTLLGAITKSGGGGGLVG